MKDFIVDEFPSIMGFHLFGLIIGGSSIVRV